MYSAPLTSTCPGMFSFLKRARRRFRLRQGQRQLKEHRLGPRRQFTGLRCVIWGNRRPPYTRRTLKVRNGILNDNATVAETKEKDEPEEQLDDTVDGGPPVENPVDPIADKAKASHPRVGHMPRSQGEGVIVGFVIGLVDVHFIISVHCNLIQMKASN